MSEETCSAVTLARDDANDTGKLRRCELVAGHDGKHETTYCGRSYTWDATRRVARAKETRQA